jgi:hypothetical protein
LNYLPGLASNHDVPDLSVPNSWDYRYEPLAPSRDILLSSLARCSTKGRWTGLCNLGISLNPPLSRPWPRVTGTVMRPHVFLYHLTYAAFPPYLTPFSAPLWHCYALVIFQWPGIIQHTVCAYCFLCLECSLHPFLLSPSTVIPVILLIFSDLPWRSVSRYRQSPTYNGFTSKLLTIWGSKSAIHSVKLVHCILNVELPLGQEYIADSLLQCCAATVRHEKMTGTPRCTVFLSLFGWKGRCVKCIFNSAYSQLICWDMTWIFQHTPAPLIQTGSSEYKGERVIETRQVSSW